MRYLISAKKNDFKYGYDEFPDVPIARDPFPENQHSRPYEEYPLERSMISRGVRILDPSIGCYQNLSRDHVLYTLSDREDYEEWDHQGFYFSPIIEYDKENVINFQFNPFHPMAIHMIRSAEWRDSVLVGTYEYRKKLIKFSFDLMDKRWRIHSEDWRQILPNLIGSLEVFDMVAIFDFANVLKLRIQMRNVEPYVVEPIQCIGGQEPPYPYSYIGPYSKRIDRGIGKYLRSPYSRYSMEKKQDSEMRKYIDITKLCNYFHTDNTLSFFDNIYHFKGDLIESSDIFFRSVKRKKGNEDVFSYRVFLEEESQLCEDLKRTRKKWKYVSVYNQYDFMRVECHFTSFPRNTSGSIIYSYNCVTLLDAIRSEEIFHEFLPMFASIDEMIYGGDGGDEILEQDVIEITAEDLDFQRSSSSKGLDKAVYRCYKCGLSILKPKVVNINGVVTLVHSECYKCECGADQDLVYHQKEHGFQCSKSWQCSYARRCYVCNCYVMDKNRLKNDDIYLHDYCVPCFKRCNTPSIVLLQGNKVKCAKCDTVKRKKKKKKKGFCGGGAHNVGAIDRAGARMAGPADQPRKIKKMIGRK